MLISFNASGTSNFETGNNNFGSGLEGMAVYDCSNLHSIIISCGLVRLDKFMFMRLARYSPVIEVPSDLKSINIVTIEVLKIP